MMLLSILLVHAAALSQSPAAVNLGTAGTFAILAKTGISATGTTHITGDLGVSPITSTAVTGFGLIMGVGNTFSTSALVTGNIYASDYTEPTPTKMIAAISDLESAYTNAAGRTLPDHSELGTGNITSMTLAPGLYNWTTGVQVGAAGVTLSGSDTDVWIFQIAGNLTLASSAQVFLTGGALPSNIFWQVAGEANLGTTSAMKGIILSKTAIIISTGATLAGRALAQSNVTLDANDINAPVPLPVELVSFTATVRHAAAQLLWSTATEVNNYGFEVERRQSAEWQKIGFVAGAGTSNSAREYSYTDNNLPEGFSTYRIKQIDRDGKFAYYGSAAVEMMSTPQVFALAQNYPNPFNPTTNISFTVPANGRATLVVFNTLGQNVATLFDGEAQAGKYNRVQFNAASLPSGLYFSRLAYAGNVQMKAMSFIK